MMQSIAFLTLLAGTSALQKPSASDIMRMTLKSRSISDVTLDMEAEDTVQDTQDSEGNPSHTTRDEIGWSRGAFAGFVITTAAAAFGTYKYLMGPGAISEQQEETTYNKVAPAAMIIMALFMFFSVVGGIVALNNKVGTSGTKTNFPGYEGKSVAYERIDNPGERAFFAGGAIVAQAIIGLLVCLYLRKQQDIQMSTSMIMKMACRGATLGILATMGVEFVRLPFHDYMMNEEIVVSRVICVLLWVGFIAFLEELVKLLAVAVGLKRNQEDTLAEVIAESPQALAICGLAVGFGFAIIENIPRLYALALERPLAEISYSAFGEGSENFLISESTLRAGRIWTFVFWGLLNIQPWLTALAAIKLAHITGKSQPSPLDLLNALKFVVAVHFFFDLLDRSSHPLVEFVGCCAIPYAMYTFKKQWESLGTDRDGLLGNQQ